MMRHTLAEELLLLAYHDEQGVVVPPARTDVLPFACAAGLLMDLALLGRITEVNGVLEVSDPSSTKDPLLDSVLERITASKEHLSLEEWLSRLFRAHPDLDKQILERLVAKGTLERKEKKILWIFSSTHYPSKDSAPERSLREAIRRVLVGNEPPEERTRILISLIYTTNLIAEVFPDDSEEKITRKRAKAISDGLVHMEAISNAVAAANIALGRALAATGGRPLLDKPISGQD